MPYCLSNFIFFFFEDDDYLYLILLVVKVQFFDGYGYHGTSFEQTYRCYPASFIEKVEMSSSLILIFSNRDFFIFTILSYAHLLRSIHQWYFKPGNL
jgi:hypothetical protein